LHLNHRSLADIKMDVDPLHGQLSSYQECCTWGLNLP
jgi:hypothetical protein